MKKTFFCTLFALTAAVVMLQSSSAEARHRGYRGGPRVQVSLGTSYVNTTPYVVNYVQPVQQVAYVPQTVVVPATATTTTYTAPVYVVQTPYVVQQQVYVAPTYRPITFGGLSFSWLFR